MDYKIIYEDKNTLFKLNGDGDYKGLYQTANNIYFAENGDLVINCFIHKLYIRSKNVDLTLMQLADSYPKHNVITYCRLRFIHCTRIMAPKIIALCGHMHSGKSTAAKYYQTRGYEVISFATPLKDVVKTAFGLTDNEIANKDTPADIFGAQIAPRKLLQYVGTELFQHNLHMPHIGRNIWALNLARRMEKHKKYVIDDMRFIHEYETIKKYYPEMITILIHKPAPVVEPVHESECVVCPINYKVANCGTIAELHAALDALF